MTNFIYVPLLLSSMIFTHEKVFLRLLLFLVHHHCYLVILNWYLYFLIAHKLEYE